MEKHCVKSICPEHQLAKRVESNGNKEMKVVQRQRIRKMHRTSILGQNNTPEQSVQYQPLKNASNDQQERCED